MLKQVNIDYSSFENDQKKNDFMNNIILKESQYTTQDIEKTILKIEK